MPSPIVTAKPRTGPDAEHEEQRGRDQRRQVGVDDRRVGALEARIERRDRARPFACLFADALVDQDVGVDRKPDAKHDAGDAGQASASRPAD